jgi:hypothetical protein
MAFLDLRFFRSAAAVSSQIVNVELAEDCQIKARSLRCLL